MTKIIIILTLTQISSPRVALEPSLNLTADITGAAGPGDVVSIIKEDAKSRGGDGVVVGAGTYPHQGDEKRRGRNDRGKGFNVLKVEASDEDNSERKHKNVDKLVSYRNFHREKNNNKRPDENSIVWLEDNETDIKIEDDSEEIMLADESTNDSQGRLALGEKRAEIMSHFGERAALDMQDVVQEAEKTREDKQLGDSFDHDDILIENEDEASFDEIIDRRSHGEISEIDMTGNDESHTAEQDTEVKNGQGSDVNLIRENSVIHSDDTIADVGSLDGRAASNTKGDVSNGISDTRDAEETHAHKGSVRDRGRRVTKLILLSYMRSGSSYLGSLLQISPEVFYFFEPLYSTQKNFGEWDKFKYVDGHTIKPKYYSGTETIQGKTQNRSPPEAYYLPNSVAVQSLTSALDCRLSDLDLETLNQVTMGYSVHTAALQRCVGNSSHDPSKVRHCCDRVTAHCRSALTVGAKVIRLSVLQARAMMEADESVQLLHLIRDPRGMFLSQVWRRFYPREFVAETIPFCARIARDLEDHATLTKDFPGRTLLVRYEDVVRFPIMAVTQIYDFAGILFDDNLRSQTLLMSKNKSRPYTWREKIGAERAKIVEENCASLFHLMGYRIFPNDNSVVDKDFTTLAESFAEGWPGEVVRVVDTLDQAES